MNFSKKKRSLKRFFNNFGVELMETKTISIENSQKKAIFYSKKI